MGAWHATRDPVPSGQSPNRETPAADRRQEGHLLGDCQMQEGVLYNQRGAPVVVGRGLQ